MDPVALLEEVLGIYSPTGKEELLAAYLCRRMKAMGYSHVRIDSGGNALGEMGQGERSVLLCGHMDTVPGDLPVRNSEGYVLGRGASDAKSALCAMLIAGERAASCGVRIAFAGATREEGDSLGVRTLLKSKDRIDYAVFGEPSGAHKVTIGYRGRMSMTIRLRTVGGHAGSPWAHVSALDEFYRLLDRLRSLETEKTVNGDHFRSLSITPTLVRAGAFHNVLPDSCNATFDIRIPPGSDCSSVRDALERIIADFEARNPGSAHKFGESTEPYMANPGSRLVRAFQRAIITRAAAKPVMVKKTGTGDMNTFAAARSAECVTYGPGDSSLSHTDGERVSVEDYLKSIDVLAEAIAQLRLLSMREG